MFDLPTAYVRIRRNWLSVRLVRMSGEAGSFEGVAAVAVQGDDKVVAAASDATDLPEARDVTVIRAFCHPRAVISDFDRTAPVLRAFLQTANSGRRLMHRILMVIHPLDRLEGGLTDVEHRALIELGVTVGGQLDHIHVLERPNELTDAEILKLPYL